MSVTEKGPELEAQCERSHARSKVGKILLAFFLGWLVLSYHHPVVRITGQHKLPQIKLPGIEITRDQSPELASLEGFTQSFQKDASVAEQLFIDSPSSESLMELLHQYTKHPHLAGNLALARLTRDKWLAAGLRDVEIVEYEVLLNYPTNRSQVSLYDKHEKLWSATLKEDVLEEDPGSIEAVPFFHGYSKNGSAHGALTYLNYGRPEDFQAVAKTIDLKGKIGIARYGGLFRGIKVELAQKYGMSAILLYDDPSEDRNITTENGYKSYPDGPARNPSSVQRGSVQFLSILPGDPTTPGYASVPGCKRQDPYKSIPGIPSIPISVRDAAYLLKTLNGVGPSLPGFAGSFPDVTYNVGGGHKSHQTVKLDNVVDYDLRPIYNVIARIPGHFDDTIILGNHRDAWVRGASDPNSGSTALDSVIGTFAALQRTGYVPLRSLVFASWDAEEYGLVGSTEWVEEHAKELSKNAVAYLNVDVASSGLDFRASASPFLFDILRNVTKLVPSVHQNSRIPGTQPQRTLHDDWHGRIKTLGSGSDFTAFQDALGITSVDMGFTGGKSSESVYHYHSQYDSFHWLTTVGDPGLKALQASTRLWGLLAYRLAEQPVIAFNATTYGTELQGYLSDLTLHPEMKHEKSKGSKRLNAITKNIRLYGADLDARAQATNQQIARWAELNEKEQLELLRTVHALNDEYKHFERAFLDPKGLKDRPFFKHVLFAPGRWTGYAGSIFPSITEAKTKKERVHAIERVAKILKSVGIA